MSGSTWASSRAATAIPLNYVELQATVSDPDSSLLTVSFYGRPYCQRTQLHPGGPAGHAVLHLADQQRHPSDVRRPDAVDRGQPGGAEHRSTPPIWATSWIG